MGGYGISLLHLSYFYYLYLSLLAKMRAVEQRNNLISAPKPQQEIFLIYLKLSYEIISVVFIKLFKISFPKPHPLSRKLYNQELLSFTQMFSVAVSKKNCLRETVSFSIKRFLDNRNIAYARQHHYFGISITRKSNTFNLAFWFNLSCYFMVI